MLVPDVVDEQPRWSIDVAHDDVDVAVVIDITKCGAAADATLLKGLDEGRRVFEVSVTEVAKQQTALVVREGFAQSRLLSLDRSIRGEQIEPAVVVEVEPRCAEAGEPPGGLADARGIAALFEES